MKYPPEEVARLGAQGFAFKMPDGTWCYPVVNEEDLKTAIIEVTTAGADYDPVRVFLMKRATDLGLIHTIPITWAPDGSLRPAGGTTDGRSNDVRDSLVRAWAGVDALSLRDANGDMTNDGNTLVGMFAVYDRWTEINSSYEGHFMERIAPGAFSGSLERRTPRVLFNHGKDPSVGLKPLGTIGKLEETPQGMRYEVPLFDAAYVRELKPAIAAGALGASFRFGPRSDGDVIDTKPVRSEHNPHGIPEVTRTAVDLYEFGPVTFGQYPEATSGLRSMTDEFVEQMLNDPLFLARLVERAGLKNIEPLLERAREALDAQEKPEAPEGIVTPDAVRDAEELATALAERRRYVARLF